MRIDRLGDLGTAAEVLRAVAGAAAARRLPPPAALAGDWFGSAAVIAPTVPVRAITPAEAFAVPPGDRGDAVGGGWIGYLSYPDAASDAAPPRIPEAAGGWTDSVLRLDRDGCWWHESLSAAPIAAWVADALSDPAAARIPTKSTGRNPISHATKTGWRPAWQRSAPARSTRPASARNSPARCAARRWSSSPMRSPEPHRPGPPTWPAIGVRWPRCLRSCSSAGSATT